MAIKIYGDKIVFPDNTEQTTASDSADTSYTKEEIDAQQNAQDVKIDKNTSDLTNVYTKTEVDDSQSAQDTEIAKKLNDAPEDGETYARNNKTWVSIAGSSGIPDAPVDGAMYGRRDGEWDTVADAGDIYTKTETNDLLDEKADKSTTYTKTEVDLQQEAQDTKIDKNAEDIANLPAPVDTYTKTEIDTQQNAQDVEIAKKANTADTYTKTQTDTLLDSKANVGDSYTKAETYNNTEIDSKLFEKADKTTTYTKDEVDASQDAQDVNISGNTSAIGTLSGRVSANEQDIATLQDGIFFSSSYSADYPDNPNRDPQTGNMYMQDLSAFTYSYADTNQVFLSKTDEQGNVRQFTAVKPDDTIVLNQVESPNYGRYKVVSVNDVGAYVSLVVVFQIGEGTLLEGDTVALQAFPASAGGSGGGGTVANGCIYLNNQTIEDDYTIPTGMNGMSAGAIEFNGTVTVPDGSKYHVVDSQPEGGDSIWEEVGDVATYDGDIKVNGVTVGRGGVEGNSPSNTVVGKSALSQDTTGANTAVGYQSLQNTTGSSNTAIGKASGSSLTTGSYNVLIGENAQPSAPDVNGEVTIGDDNVTKTRLKGNVELQQVVYTGDELNKYDYSTTINKATNDLVTASKAGYRWLIDGGTKLILDKDGSGNGQLRIPDLPSTSNANPANVYANSSGQLHISTATTYTAEETETAIDKKLAIKDKIIEALEARLTKLEARIK